MRNGLRQVLGHHWRRLRRRVFGSVVAKKEHDGESRVAARARFWAELREGQREAEARCSRQQL